MVHCCKAKPSQFPTKNKIVRTVFGHFLERSNGRSAFEHLYFRSCDSSERCTRSRMCSNAFQDVFEHCWGERSELKRTQWNGTPSLYTRTSVFICLISHDISCPWQGTQSVTHCIAAKSVTLAFKVKFHGPWQGITRPVTHYNAAKSVILAYNISDSLYSQWHLNPKSVTVYLVSDSLSKVSEISIQSQWHM